MNVLTFTFHFNGSVLLLVMLVSGTLKFVNGEIHRRDSREIDLPNTLNMPRRIMKNKSSLTELLLPHGYHTESHPVTTTLNSTLVLHRIPCKANIKHCKVTENQHPVLLIHGMAQSSRHWFLKDNFNESLPIALVESGYDVWMGNSRGNVFSSGRSVSDDLYWDHSFHEIGDEDIPRIIDHILKETNKPQLSCIGYSLGTTVLLVALALHPEYQPKVNFSIHMGPVAYMSKHAKSNIAAIGSLPITAKIFEHYRKTFKIGPIQDEIGGNIIKTLCGSNIVFATICSMFFTDFSGTTKSGSFGLRALQSVTNPGHAPKMNIFQIGFSSMSFKTIVHLLQIIGSGGRFAQFDYGEENVSKYGDFCPPIYPVHKIKVPSAIFWSDNDIFVPQHDLSMLVKNLPNVVVNYRVPDENFTHLDFNYGIDAYNLVYKVCIQLLDERGKYKSLPK